MFVYVCFWVVVVFFFFFGGLLFLLLLSVVLFFGGVQLFSVLCVFCLFACFVFVVFLKEICVRTDFADFGEFMVRWLVCRMAGRPIKVCFQPLHNPLWLTGLKAPTN